MNLSHSSELRLWIWFGHDKCVFGGSALPEDIHVTMSYGFVSGCIDFHITKNLLSEEQIHAPWIRIYHKDIPLLMGLFEKKFLKDILGMRLLSDSSVSRIRSKIISFPEEGSLKLIEFEQEFTFRLSRFFKKKGKLHPKMKIDLNPDDLHTVLKKWIVDDPRSFERFVIVHKPKEILNLSQFSGLVVKHNGPFGLLRMHLLTKAPLNITFPLDLKFKRPRKLANRLLGSTLAQKVFSRFERSLEQLEKAVTIANFKTESPITITVTKR